MSERGSSSVGDVVLETLYPLQSQARSGTT